MKILIIGDFRTDNTHFLISHPRMFAKGFIRNGHDVQPFNYREALLADSRMKSKTWAAKWSRNAVDKLLLEQAEHYQPDMVFIVEYRLLKDEVVAKLKENLPGSLFVFWYGDPYFGETDGRVNDIVRHCDWFMATSAGKVMEHYKQDNKVDHAAFLPQMCDPDIHYPHEVDDKWRSDMLFTGKLQHGSLSHYEQDKDRPALIKYFIDNRNMSMYGDLGYPGVWGRDYLDAIAGTKIGLNINVCNDVSKYYSNRLVNYLSNGAFVLSAKVPNAEQMFEDGKHLVYFDSQEDCKEKVDYYLAHEKERNAIAEAGTEHAHGEYNCCKIAGYVVDLVEKGEYGPGWGEVI